MAILRFKLFSIRLLSRVCCKSATNPLTQLPISAKKALAKLKILFYIHKILFKQGLCRLAVNQVLSS